MISQLPARELSRRLEGPGLAFRTGPFSYRVHSDIESVAAGISLLYPDYPLVPDGDFCDFDLALSRPAGLRKHLKPQVRFVFDGTSTFEPLPVAQAFPMLEWGMNWCISTHVNRFLLIHAAVIERDGRALILPAPPGSGKSTLCAGLVHRGWRLMSDEVTMIPFDGSGVGALGRPVSLKNASIDVIGRFEPSAVFNVPTPHTAKGTVTHMKVPPGQLERLGQPAQPAWVVFPRWQAGAPAQLTAKPKSDTLVDLARNSFNYGVLGRLGFETMADVVSQCECHEFVYSQLDDAVAVFDRLSGRTA